MSDITLAPDPNDITTWDLGRLDQRRSELVLKGKASAGDLSDEELEELCAISAQMRKRSAGPPKEVKEKKARVVKQGASLDDVL